jgi:hypothetical protein
MREHRVHWLCVQILDPQNPIAVRHKLMESLIAITGDETRGRKAVELSFARLERKREQKLAATGTSKKVIFIRPETEKPTPSPRGRRPR